MKRERLVWVTEHISGQRGAIKPGVPRDGAEPSMMAFGVVGHASPLVDVFHAY